MSNEAYEYDIAISFAGEDRAYAEALADVLCNRGSMFSTINMKKLFYGDETFIAISPISIRIERDIV